LFWGITNLHIFESADIQKWINRLFALLIQLHSIFNRTGNGLSRKRGMILAFPLSSQFAGPVSPILEQYPHCGFFERLRNI
jgi:hypothetical protein